MTRKKVFKTKRYVGKTSTVDGICRTLHWQICATILKLGIPVGGGISHDAEGSDSSETWGSFQLGTQCRWKGYRVPKQFSKKLQFLKNGNEIGILALVQSVEKLVNILDCFGPVMRQSR